MWVRNYAEWAEQSNPRNPDPWEILKRDDVQGVAHYGRVTGDDIPTSHVNYPDGSVAPAEPWEITEGFLGGSGR